MEYRKYHCALAKADFGATKAGADKSHVCRGAFIHPDRDNVEDRDRDNGQDHQSNECFYSHGSYYRFESINVLRLIRHALVYC